MYEKNKGTDTVNNIFSDYFEINIGLYQGSVQRPTLVSIVGPCMEPM